MADLFQASLGLRENFPVELPGKERGRENSSRLGYAMGEKFLLSNEETGNGVQECGTFLYGALL